MALIRATTHRNARQKWNLFAESSRFRTMARTPRIDKRVGVAGANKDRHLKVDGKRRNRHSQCHTYVAAVAMPMHSMQVIAAQAVGPVALPLPQMPQPQMPPPPCSQQMLLIEQQHRELEQRRKQTVSLLGREGCASGRLSRSRSRPAW